MIIREFQDPDVIDIDRIWREHHAKDFSVPNRDNALIDAVVENAHGRVTGYGQVRLFAEAILILDKAATRREKVQTVKLLMAEAFRGMDKVGLQDLYCFIKDPVFATLISKHFSFEIVDEPGELLLRKV